MTNEKRYELICELVRAYAKLEGDPAEAERQIQDPYQESGRLHPFWAPAKELLLDGMLSISAQTTDKTRIAAVKDILTHVTIENRPGLCVMHVDTVGNEPRYCACDGYRAIRLKQDIPALPHATGDLVVDWLDMNRAFDLTTQDEINLPSIPALKACMAAHPELKRSKHFPEQPLCIDGKILVNAHYLLKMLQALPGARAWRTGKSGPSLTSPIYFEHPDLGDGMICPVYQKRDLSTYVTI